VVVVDLNLVEFMDARPLERAEVDMSLTVMPRFKTTLDPGASKPVPALEPDPRFVVELTRSAVTDGDGRVLVNFNDASVFRQLARKTRPEDQARAVDAVGFLRVGARFLDIEFAAILVANELAQQDRLERVLPIDLGMAIVGHTTPGSARLWFHVPFDPAPDHEFSCNVITIPENAALPLPGPVPAGRDLGRTVPVVFEGAAHTAVVDIDPLAPDSSHDYALRLERGSTRFALVTGRFQTPAIVQPGLKFAFGSCQLPVVVDALPGSDDPTPERALRSLERLQRLVDRKDYEFVLLTGDQIYGDGIERKWPDADPFTQYVRRYRQLWAHRPTREVLRSSPTYMILDDHDVADDFGIGNLPDTKVLAAMRAYTLFQHSHNPGERDEQGNNVGPLHYQFRWGPASFFVMDGRTQRGQGSPPTPVFGRQQLEDLRRWAASPETRSADVIFFVAPVPLALLPTEIIREVAEELTEEVFAAGGATLGTLVGLGVGAAVAGPFGAAAGAGIGAAVLGSVGYEVGEEVFENFVEGALLLKADLGERWDLRENQPDLIRLLDILFDLANGVGDDPPRKRAVFIISGDIHAATMHLIRSLPAGIGERHRANPLITQLTSSALTHASVNSTLWIEAVSKIDEEIDLDLKDLNVLTIANHNGDWESLGKEAIDVDDVFGEGKAEYFLDPNHDRRYLTQYAGLLMERTVGLVDVERRDPQRRLYRFRLAIEGQEHMLESRFELDLDADIITPRTDNASFVGQRVPTKIEPFQRVNVEITMQNTGVTTWGRGYSLDIVQSSWGVDRVAVTTPVSPGRQHTFRFTIFASSSGRFFLTARMVRGSTAFGKSTPTVSITAGGGKSCQELEEERDRVELTIDQLQASISTASPAEKQFIMAEIRTARTSLSAIQRRMAALGCD
jgi:PhoD-like phosphatase